MVAKNKMKPIYSPDHYRMKILVRSEAFQSQLKQLYERWEVHDVPVPANGFKRVKAYYAWVEKLRAACNKAEKSEKVAYAIKQIKNDTTVTTPTAYARRLMDVWKSHTPPSPDTAVDRMLKACSLDPKNKQFRQFMTGYIFFGQEEFSKPLFTVQRKRNEKTDKMEVFLKLEPHTKPAHVIAHWRWIDAHLRLTPNYLGKNKPWEEFERDLEIYETYQAIKSKEKGKRADYPGLDSATWLRLRERNKGKYEKLTLSQVRKSVAKIKALDKIDHVKG